MILLWLGVGIIGGLGALARFGLDRLVSQTVGDTFPWGTFAVNISGCFLLGVLASAHVGDITMLLAGTGAIGAYTTFSTWMLESHRLGENGRTIAVAVNVALSLMAGFAAVVFGWIVGNAL